MSCRFLVIFLVVSKNMCNFGGWMLNQNKQEEEYLDTTKLTREEALRRWNASKDAAPQKVDTERWKTDGK